MKWARERSHQLLWRQEYDSPRYPSASSRYAAILISLYHIGICSPTEEGVYPLHAGKENAGNASHLIVRITLSMISMNSLRVPAFLGEAPFVKYQTHSVVNSRSGLGGPHRLDRNRGDLREGPTAFPTSLSIRGVANRKYSYPSTLVNTFCCCCACDHVGNAKAEQSEAAVLSTCSAIPSFWIR